MDLKILKDTPPWDWPGAAGKTILAILRDPKAKASDRLTAANLAGNTVVVNDALCDALLAIAGSAAEPAELRAKAVISLGPVLEEAETEILDGDEFDDPDAVPISLKTFRKIQQTLRTIYLDAAAPKAVRRRTLETAVRAPVEWHSGAIRTAWASQDPEWKLTAVFCMRYVRGFDKEILEALESADSKIRYEAVHAAGNWQVDEAWPHVAALIAAADISKDLLLAAIGASATIRPGEAGMILADLADSSDEDISEAVAEAMSMAEGISDDEEDEDDEDFEDDEPVH